jgi:hypothetical protein
MRECTTAPAHHAGFKRRDEVAFDQALVLHNRCRALNNAELCMPQRIRRLYDAIMVTCDYFVFPDHNRADRHFILGKCKFGLGKAAASAVRKMGSSSIISNTGGRQSGAADPTNCGRNLSRKAKRLFETGCLNQANYPTE